MQQRHIHAERGYCPKSHRQVSGMSSHSSASGSSHKPLSAKRAVAAQKEGGERHCTRARSKALGAYAW
jgi:hypothetical protein